MSPSYEYSKSTDQRDPAHVLRTFYSLEATLKNNHFGYSDVVITSCSCWAVFVSFLHACELVFALRVLVLSIRGA